MKKSGLLGALCACLAILPFNASAISVSTVSIADHGSYVTDTVTGWDWLDLTATAGMSYNDVSAELVPGGSLEGWSFATRDELSTLWTAFGGDANYYSGLVWSEQQQSFVWPKQNNGLFDNIAPLMGDLRCAVIGCTTGEGFSHWITADIATPADAAAFSDITTGEHLAAVVFDRANRPEHWTAEYVNLQRESLPDDLGNPEFGSALFRTSVVPVPAAAWLFGSGLLGLFSIARRKKV